MTSRAKAFLKLGQKVVESSPSSPARRHILNSRPGILILINSTDWELEGELEYELVEGDEIVFISTLHGG